MTDKDRLPTAAILADAKEHRRQPPEDAVFNYFKAEDGEQIRFARFPASHVLEPKGTIIFLPGRTEFIEKFLEDVHIWNALGFACAAMDLRGQGMSYRPYPDRDKHYVRTFDTHIEDLKSFFDQKLVNKMPKPFILMGHSAGSHVILRFLAKYPGYAEAAITVAPMVRINAGPLPKFVTYGLPYVARHLGLGAAYIPGHTAFKEGRWGWRKKLTHDDERFCDEDFFIKEKDRRLAVGGATYKWLWEALKSCDKLNDQGVPESIETPVLMIQAGEDTIVDNKAQAAFAERMPNVKFVVVDGAMHEILKEKDEYRAEVWQAIGDFMDLKGRPVFGHEMLVPAPQPAPSKEAAEEASEDAGEDAPSA
ncbi:alpha/beta fold hydrolase [Kordiimonas marina]|uniref:alpha/beta fold hydrolase n=1 Tax=Kordiimonas marina TaxID=2872312 RepID=UPI001FF206EE|nr:alpha/beta hydrolase [Kordiimonas marina]MCJ9428597.1 alpha/beta hydrolase [Kordiimonas marina]